MEAAFLFGRILFGMFFILSSFGHLFGLKKMTAYAASKGIPSPALATFGTGLLLLGGGLGVMLGVYTEVALVLLLIFLVPVTFLMHQFWREKDGMGKVVEQTNFMKNLALIGATLMMFAVETPWSFSLTF